MNRLIQGLSLLAYQGILTLFGLVYLLVRLLRGRGLPGLKERLAWYSSEQRRGLSSLKRPIWIHLVSVGEALAARSLIEELRRRFPEKDWVVTTVTPTGREVARASLQNPKTQVLYLPWDFGPVVRRAIRWIQPSLFLCFETELWPVLFRHLASANVPIAVVNGRISPAAYRRYLWIRPLMGWTLASVDLFLTQSPQDARRYAAIGAAKDRLIITGNVKWDIQLPTASDGADPDRLRGLLALAPRQVLWTAGSTHPGEERLLLQVYRRLKAQWPTLRLLVAPRHPERIAQVEQEAAEMGLQVVRRSSLTNGSSVKGDEVVLLDTLGELAAFYRISDLVFVGGSLVPHGGHNLVEPAALARPILTGPYLHNFQAVSDALSQPNGMLIVRSAEELEQAIRRLLQDPAQALSLGRRAYAVFQENQGATRRSADLICLRWGSRLKG